MADDRFDLPRGQEWFLDCIKQIGLQVDPEGTCLGLEIMGMSAFFAKDRETFHNRLTAINWLYQDSPETFGERVLAAEEKKSAIFLATSKTIEKKIIKKYHLQSDNNQDSIFPQNLTAEMRADYFKMVYREMSNEIEKLSDVDQLIINCNIKTFLENVNFNQNPELFAGISLADLLNIAFTFSMTGSTLVKEKGGIKQIALQSDSFAVSGIYNQSDLKSFFASFQNAFSNCNLPFVLFCFDLNHVIMLAIQGDKLWLLNSNHMPGQDDILSKLKPTTIDELHKGFTKKTHTAFFTVMFCLEADVKKMQNFLKILRQQKSWKELHKVTFEKACLNDSKGSSWLVSAVMGGDAKSVGKILSMREKNIKINPEQKLPFKKIIQNEAKGQKDKIILYTPLILAVVCNHLNVVNELLHHPTNPAYVNTPDQDNNSPLLFAVKIENIEIVKTLLEKKAKVNAANDDGVTPLFSAVKNENLELVKILLAANANVNTVTKDSDFPLFQAVQNGNTKILELLLSHGAVQDQKYSATVADCKTFAMIAGCVTNMQTFIDKHHPQSDAEELGMTAHDLAVIFEDLEMINLLEKYSSKNKFKM